MHDIIRQRFKQALPTGIDFCSLRFSTERTETISMRRGSLEPVSAVTDRGLMVTVHSGGGLGYAATPIASIRAAILRAKRWAEHTGANSSLIPVSSILGIPWRVQQPGRAPLGQRAPSGKLDIPKQVDRQLPIDKRIVEWTSDLVGIQVQSLYLTSDGGMVQRMKSSLQT